MKHSLGVFLLKKKEEKMTGKLLPYVEMPPCKVHIRCATEK